MKPTNCRCGQAERPSRAAAAEYIAVEASRLARIANANEFPLLAYLIDMVVLEAWREASEADADGRGDDAARTRRRLNAHGRSAQRHALAGWRSMRPARSSSSRTTCTIRAGKPGEADDLVDLDRRRPERLDDARCGRCPPAPSRARRMRRAEARSAAASGGCASIGATASMTSRDLGHHARALLDQTVRCRRRADRAAIRARRRPRGSARARGAP